MVSHIESKSNARVKHMRKLGVSRSYRYENHAFLCDGVKLLDEAKRSGAKIRQVFVEETELEQLLSGRAWLEDIPVFTTSEVVLRSMSSLDTPQSVLFECEMKLSGFQCLGRTILLDRLQDVGNIGTIIRAADAFSLSGVVLDGCADPYNPKTVRAAMGSIFRVPITEYDCLAAISEYRAEQIPVYAAVLSENAKSVHEVDLKNAVVIVGNEGAGIRQEVAEACENIIIPMSGQAESLNVAVAAGILIWQMS